MVAMHLIGRVFVLLFLAVPAWAQPNQLAVVQRVAAADPARFTCAHTDRPCAYDFIEALVCELRASDTRWGMNGRRGDPTRPSWDALNWCGSGPATDPTGACTQPVTIVDVIAGAGGPNPQPTWQVFANDATPGAFLVPDCAGGGGSGGGGTDGPDLAAVLDQLASLRQQVSALADLVGRFGLELTAAAQAATDANERAKDVQARLTDLAARPVLSGAWPEYQGRVLGASITLRPRP